MTIQRMLQNLDAATRFTRFAAVAAQTTASRFLMLALPGILLGLALGLAYAAGDLESDFSNRGGIINTRHNMTQRQAVGGPTGIMMDTYRNDYGEICVYCHTPHGANTTTTLPLWNRTMKSTTYTLYNQERNSSLQGEISQPGNNSLACLSCHDGQTAVDSIINMPGSGNYLKAQETAQNDGFLDTWTNPRGQDAPVHAALNSTECLACHSSTAGKVLGAGAADFTQAVIGTDLRNDHPVGITYPTRTGDGTGFNTPVRELGKPVFFDSNTNGRMDASDLRLFPNAGKAQVECASCHDPHGVPSAGPNSVIFPTFLRRSNEGSALCLTCHSK